MILYELPDNIYSCRLKFKKKTKCLMHAISNKVRIDYTTRRVFDNKINLSSFSVLDIGYIN